MEPTMRLCHGTSEARLHRILREGIRPRTGSQRGNYEGEIRSVSGHTYLTGYYPLFYAMNASPSVIMQKGRPSRRNPKRVIIEVDTWQLDPNLLRPDEDALRQYLGTVEMLSDDAAFRRVYRRTPTDVDRALLQRIVDLIPGGAAFVTLDAEAMRELWPHSYRLIGSMAYKGVVPPEAIIRYATIDPFYSQSIMHWVENTEMNVMNHFLFGALRGALTDLILDGTPLPTIGLSPDFTAAGIQKFRENFWATESDRLAAEAERQKGVRVYTPRHAQGASEVDPAA